MYLFFSGFLLFSFMSVHRAFHIPKRIFSIRGIEERVFQNMKSSSGKHNMGRSMTPEYVPKTPNQQNYVDALGKHSLVFGIGPAGCGKTLFACKQAIKELQSGNIQKIVLTRPVVSVEEDIGFLPGNIHRKMDPWLQPLFDVFLEYYTQRDLDEMILNGTIEISPLGFMRGRTFKRVFILADEMQNSSPNQMLMLLTRLGERSRMVITGDLSQSDIRSSTNGLADFYSKYSKWNTTDNKDIEMIFMNEQDVQRSSIVKSILSIYEDKPLEKYSNCSKNEDIGAVPSSYEPPDDNDAAMIPRSQISRNEPL